MVVVTLDKKQRQPDHAHEDPDLRPRLIRPRREHTYVCEEMPMPGGSVEWGRRVPVALREPSLYDYIADKSALIGTLPDFTRLIIDPVLALRNQGVRVGFTIGLLTSGGPKWINWAKLDANTRLLQMHRDFTVVSTAAVHIPTEFRFGRYSDEDFAMHWDKFVATIGGAKVDRANNPVLGPRPQKSGYLFVTKGAFLSYGARCELEMAHKVNAAAHDAGESSPRIVMLDVKHDLSDGLNVENVRANMLYNILFVDSLVRVARGLTIAKVTHPKFTEAINRGLHEIKDNMDEVHAKVEEDRGVVMRLSNELRHELKREHPEFGDNLSIHRKLDDLPAKLIAIQRGVEKAIA